MARDDALSLRAINFALQIDGIQTATFQSVDGIGSHNEVIEHRACDTKGKQVIYKLPGRLVWDDITFRRGTTNGKELADWRKKVEDGKIDEARKNVSIVLYTADATEVARWNLTNAWPRSIKITNVNAQTDETSVEEMTIVHEGLVRG